MAWDRIACPKKDGGLGFRDLRAFNMSMVAKQEWKLLTCPRALVSKIYKAGYFPKTSFFEASIGNNPSFVWRSIWQDRNVLTLGCRWGIGDGNSEDIIRVPLLDGVRKDRWIWKEEQNGVYSVRSGYRLWRNNQEKFVNRRVIGNWGNLWSIKAQPRIKHLLWRICRDYLPIRSRLHHHHVQCPLECLNDIVLPRLTSFHDVKSIILDICTNEDSRTAGRFSTMLDVIWNNRNKAIWNNETDATSTLGTQAFYRWQDWYLAQDWKESGNSDHRPSVWEPPDTGWLKCNVDAGFSNNRGTTNRGWCVRDNRGSFILGGIAWDLDLLSVVEAEALALKEAIQGAITNHLDKVIFESDALKVVQAIHSNHCGNSEFSVIILSTQSLLQIYSNFEVKFVKRQANMVAHSLANVAISWSRRSSFNVPPPCIEHILINEMC
ncbi:uncharacterized protein LOC131658309 [Vicia villosa]|uniref:uncharacterized protein LOC131658309 n=1 Tax=Vicia villosa TaxID=3911 RepID=UPI00273AD0F1|nr:uncharacterized protein LOC131658309 [Vicia villosa]